MCRQIARVVAVFVFLHAVSPVQAEAIIYNVDMRGGSLSVTGTVTFDTVLDTITNSALTFSDGIYTHGGTPPVEFGKPSLWDYVATPDGRLLFHQKVPSETYAGGWVGLVWYFDPLPWETWFESILIISTTTEGKPFFSLAYGVLSLGIDVNEARIFSPTADVLIGTVPEPSTWLMAVTALTAFYLRQTRSAARACDSKSTRPICDWSSAPC
jgi:hypothetical protein